MRILHVIHSVDPRSGGPSHALREMTRAQLDSGHEITVLATAVQSAEPWSPAYEYAQQMSDDSAFAGADFRILPAYGRRRPWSRWAYTPSARHILNSLLQDRSNPPDVVHIHGTFSHLTTVAAQVSYANGVPYVLRPAGSLNAKCLEQGASRVKAAFIRLLLNRELKRAACVHAMSESEAIELSLFVPANRVAVVPHGINIPRPSTTSANVFLERFPMVRGRPCILFLSRLHPKKQVSVLVEAFGQIRERVPDAVLVVAGSDSGDLSNAKHAANREHVGDRVIFSGFLEGETKADAFRAADVFALPSIDENFGVAVVEAMAHGTPVLVTPGVAAHVHVDASGCGMTVDGTRDAMADALLRILASNREQLGGRGRDYVMTHLAWPAIVRRLDALYQDCIAASKNRNAKSSNGSKSSVRFRDNASC